MSRGTLPTCRVVKTSIKAGLFALAALHVLGSSARAQQTVEVMHFWTTGGEAAALDVVKKKVMNGGVGWQDAPIAGGGGDQAKTALQARIVSGNPPAAMLMLGHNIIDWAKAGMLADLKDIAAAGDWENLLPKPVQQFTRVDGRWVSAPTNVHRVNMVWASKAAFDKINAKPPATWAEFNALAPQFIKAGVTPLAHGGQPWQDFTLFDSVALGIGGQEFYQKAFIELDKATLGGQTMIKVFDQMRVLRGFVDENFSGRDWNLATSMVIEGKAAMQIMGDWSKGEFTNANKVANTDFLCFPSPGTQGAFVFLINSFSMFEQKTDGAQKAQAVVAQAIMDPEVQRQFNLKKGSIPARRGVSTEGMDACALMSSKDFEAASNTGAALPTIAFTHAAPAAIVGEMTDIVTRHFNSNMSSTEAAAEMARLAAK